MAFCLRVFKRSCVSDWGSAECLNGSHACFLLQPRKHVYGQTPRRLYARAPAPANNPHFCSTLPLISYLCSAGRGVLSESRASPAGCRRYQCYQIPLLAPTPKKTAAPRPAWPALRPRQCAYVPNKDPATFGCVCPCACACVRACVCVCERERVHLGTVISAAAPRCLISSCGTECMSRRRCCLYFSEPRVSFWMKE